MIPTLLTYLHPYECDVDKYKLKLTDKCYFLPSQAPLLLRGMIEMTQIPLTHLYHERVDKCKLKLINRCCFLPLKQSIDIDHA